MIWRNPLAWIGLGTLLVPIAIHLLVRQQAEPLLFPSLRFLQTSRLAAVRRRAISDWLLLALRLLALALAVAALADPFFISDSRRAAWSSRTARAIIVDTSASVDRTAAIAAATREQASAFQATQFEATDVSEGIARAGDWLRTAPPAAREIAIVSDFQRGSVTAATLRALPAFVGVRFVRVGTPIDRRSVDGRTASMRTATSVGARTPTVTILPDRTEVQWHADERAGATDADALGLRLRTTPDDRAAARAALDAVLAEGIPIARPANRRVVVAIGDAARAMTGDATLQPLAAPWMADALRAVANDPALGDSVRASMDVGVGVSGNAIGAPGSPDPTQVSRGSGAAAGAAAISATAAAPAPATPPAAALRPVLSTTSGTPVIFAASASDANAADRSAAGAGDGSPALVVLSMLPATREVTPLLLRAIVRATAAPDPLPEAEVATLTDADLAAWQRPAALPPVDQLTRVDGRDRRWLWAAALVALALETWLRRRTREAVPDTREAAHAA
jgi:hypothetical protein